MRTKRKRTEVKRDKVTGPDSDEPAQLIEKDGQPSRKQRANKSSRGSRKGPARSASRRAAAAAEDSEAAESELLKGSQAARDSEDATATAAAATAGGGLPDSQGGNNTSSSTIKPKVKQKGAGSKAKAKQQKEKPPKKKRKSNRQHGTVGLPQEILVIIMEAVAGSLEPGGLRGPSAVAADLGRLSLVCWDFYHASKAGVQALAAAAADIHSKAADTCHNRPTAALLDLPGSQGLGGWNFWDQAVQKPGQLSLKALKRAATQLGLQVTGTKEELMLRVLAAFLLTAPTTAPAGLLRALLLERGLPDEHNPNAPVSFVWDGEGAVDTAREVTKLLVRPVTANVCGGEVLSAKKSRGAAGVRATLLAQGYASLQQFITAGKAVVDAWQEKQRRRQEEKRRQQRAKEEKRRLQEEKRRQHEQAQQEEKRRRQRERAEEQRMLQYVDQERFAYLLMLERLREWHQRPAAAVQELAAVGGGSAGGCGIGKSAALAGSSDRAAAAAQAQRMRQRALREYMLQMERERNRLAAPTRRQRLAAAAAGGLPGNGCVCRCGNPAAKLCTRSCCRKCCNTAAALPGARGKRAMHCARHGN